MSRALLKPLVLTFPVLFSTLLFESHLKAAEVPPAFTGWPATFNGIAPDTDLELDFNNIGYLDPDDGLIYTCLRIQSGLTPEAEVNALRIDTAIATLSGDQEVIRILEYRPFNAGNDTTELGEAPSCSGVFDTTTGLYTDVIQIGDSTYRFVHEIANIETLELHLQQSTKLLPFDGWPAAYNGVTPHLSLNLGINNIGVLDPSNLLIHSCLEIQTNQHPVQANGAGRFDLELAIVSIQQGLVQVRRIRPFNARNAVKANGEAPTCSGVFETTTGRYKDVLQVGDDAFRITLELTNPNTLELRLVDAVPLCTIPQRCAANLSHLQISGRVIDSPIPYATVAVEVGGVY